MKVNTALLLVSSQIFAVDHRMFQPTATKMIVELLRFFVVHITCMKSILAAIVRFFRVVCLRPHFKFSQSIQM